MTPTNTDVDTCLARLEEMEREDEAVIARYRALELPERHVCPAVELRHVLWAMGLFALILAGFVYVTKAWEWWTL